MRFFDAEVERRGLRAAVERYLSRVASGWPKNAYHALIGAPEFVPLEVPQSVPPLTWDAATESDEHRVKLAYTCRAHAQAFGDPSYAWVVRACLEG